MRLVGWSDASLNLPKSVAGSVIALVDEANEDTFILLHWQSKTIQMAGYSSAAVEYVAAGNLPEVLATLQETCEEIGLLSKNAEIPIENIDSQPVLQGIRRGYAPYEPLFAKLTKTCRLRISQLNYLEENNLIKFQYVKTNENLADGLTKILDGQKIVEMHKMLRMQ